eukprot:6180056-Pleurochrysis_carterae.AAC.4
MLVQILSPEQRAEFRLLTAVRHERYLAQTKLFAASVHIFLLPKPRSPFALKNLCQRALLTVPTRLSAKRKRLAASGAGQYN